MGQSMKGIHGLEELTKVIQPDLVNELQRMFPSYHNSIPESFLGLVIEDVYSASAWKEEGVYSGDDISLAIQRQVLYALNTLTLDNFNVLFGNG